MKNIDIETAVILLPFIPLLAIMYVTWWVLRMIEDACENWKFQTYRKQSYILDAYNFEEEVIWLIITLITVNVLLAIGDKVARIENRAVRIISTFIWCYISILLFYLLYQLYLIGGGN